MRRIPKPSLMEGKGDHVVVDEMNINPFCSRNSERRGRRSLQKQRVRSPKPIDAGDR